MLQKRKMPCDALRDVAVDVVVVGNRQGRDSRQVRNDQVELLVRDWSELDSERSQ